MFNHAIQLDEKLIEKIKNESKKLKKMTDKNPLLEKRLEKELRKIERIAIDKASEIGQKAGAITDTMRQTAYKIALKQEGYGEKRFSRVMHRVAVFSTRAEEAMKKAKDPDRFLDWLNRELEKHMVFEKEFKAAPTKTYLSKLERQDVMVFIAVGGIMQKVIEENKNLSDKERLYIEEASKAITLFYKELIGRVGKDEIKRIGNEANFHELALVTPTKNKEIKKDNNKKSLTWEFGSEDERDDVVMGLIETFCRGCKQHPIRDCGIRKMFMKQEIEPINYFAGKGECQYKYPDKD